MFDRRSIFAATAAATSALSGLFTGRRAVAKATKPMDVEPRRRNGLLERLPSLGLEARQDFLTEFRGWVNSDFSRAVQRRADAVVRAKGIDPNA
jgi:hypothetical protein